MNPFRFIHAADLHLGSPFKGLSGVPEHVRRGLAEAEFGALRRLTEAALGESVDFVVIAGDLFDSADRSLRARAALHRSWSRLTEAGVQVFAIHGNHDPLGAEQARLDWPEGVHIFGAGGLAEHRPAYRRDGKPAAFVYGISYDRRAVADNLVPGYRPAAGADFHIALLHANVDGDPNHDAYAPCRLSELTGAGFQYWALGHIHGRRVLHEYPHVVYPGNLQGRHPGETGEKGCYLVDVDASGGVRLTFLPLDGVRWLACRVPIGGIADEERLLERMETSVYGAAATADGRPVMLEIVLEGRGPLHRRLESRGADELLAALRERIGEPMAGDGAPDGLGRRGGLGGNGGPDGPGWIWVHRLTLRTAPDLDPDRLAEEDCFAGEAVRLARRLAADPEGREALMAEALEPMMRNPRLRRLLESRGWPGAGLSGRRAADGLTGRPSASADGLLERAAMRLADLLEREDG